MTKAISEIVLTGGPCAGKTTFLSRADFWLRDHGFRVFLVPEVATLMIQAGLSDLAQLAASSPELYLEIQRTFLDFQMDMRKNFLKLAGKFPQPGVIIYDRGPMDGRAYMEKNHFSALLEEGGYDLSQTRDNFNAVIHLVTAAIGAEQFYMNNPVRKESLPEAAALDERTRAAWSGHPHLKIIDNSTGFDLKMKRTIAAVARVLGIPVPLEIERKYLLRSMPDLSRLPHVEAVRIEQLYLVSEVRGERARIRKRTATDGSSMYYYTVKKSTSNPAIRHEEERIIKATDFYSLQSRQRPGTINIIKTRYCFIWKNQYFELDAFENPSVQPFLELELTEENDRIELPDFLDIDRDVTEEKGFSNFYLARHF